MVREVKQQEGEYFYVSINDYTIESYNPDTTNSVWLDQNFVGPFYLFGEAVKYIIENC